MNENVKKPSNDYLRKIIHIDMDAFFTSIEQRDNPSLRGNPVVVGSPKNRGVIAAASYEARKFGIYSAMPSKIALQKCPNLIFIKHRFTVYKATSLIIQSIFKEYTNLVEPLSLDEAYLDVSHNKKGIPIATDIAKEIKSRIIEQTGLTASAGVSINKFLAKIASDMDKPNGLFIIKPHQVHTFIETLPIEKIPGVGKFTSIKMKSLGIFTGNQLRQFSEKQLIHKFGKAGSYFYNVARGIDNKPVIPNRERKSLSIESTFEYDYTDIQILSNELKQLSITIANRLKRTKNKPTRLTLKVKFSNFIQITRSKTNKHIIDRQETIYTIAENLLINILKPHHKIRLLGICLSNFEKSGKKNKNQLTLEF